MVDFSKRLGGKRAERPTDPIKLYDTLDRQRDKGPLRPAQVAVLEEWRDKRQPARDVIVKLHTGQGKTLIGLLMLQARLNGGHGPAAYLCPNNFLIDQTAEQARQFGFQVCLSEGDLPGEFLEGKQILITSAQKLFNGITKFGLNQQSVKLGSILLDDAHACADVIRDQCRIRIPAEEPAYAELKRLFAGDLERQGVGTFADLENGDRNALLPIPYWAWAAHEADVAGVLSKHSGKKSIKFAWPLLRDSLAHCQCVFTGAALEIEPYIAPLDAFGSYFAADRRIFMSATVTDDAFLVKGLQLQPDTIRDPLTFVGEGWSGEKMVLLPSLMHEDLDRGLIISHIGKPNIKRAAGRVSLTPSFSKAEDWVKAGALIAKDDNFNQRINDLLEGNFEHTVVLANRYDGIDLPDKACRVLVFDSAPYSENLIDLYEERVRPNSEASLMRLVRSIEQGMGRSVRGEKDYSVVIATGADLVRILRDRHSREYLSNQMQKQIEIGLEISDMAKEEIENNGVVPLDALKDVMRQCINRDENWKAFYAAEMSGVKVGAASGEALDRFAAELQAERLFQEGDYQKAAERLQKLLDERPLETAEVGWYLQQNARYLYQHSRLEAEKLQVIAHKKNRKLLRPEAGVTVAKLSLVSHGRAERVKAWVAAFPTYDDLNIRVTELLGRLVFGTRADPFEEALDSLSFALGFVGERPDKDWKEGPDNLWALNDKEFLLFECKSEVDTTRAQINKREAEQMNRSAVWFDKHYAGQTATRILIHPSHKLESAAGLTHNVTAMTEKELRKLVGAVRSFFKSFESKDLADLSVSDVQALLTSHKLGVGDLASAYARSIKNF